MTTGRIVKALYAVADLMEADNARCIAAYGAPVGIPASYGDHLIRQAVTGPADAWRTEWVRRACTESLEAATAWADDLTELRQQVSALVYPGGANGAGLAAAEVRAVADRINMEG